MSKLNATAEEAAAPTITSRASGKEADVQTHRVERVLDDPGLRRNVKKGQWEPVQLVEHLGLEIHLKESFECRWRGGRSTVPNLRKASARLSAKEPATFNGRCNSVYPAVPTARLYLHELCFAAATKRG
ncbi:hypothetical protein CYMTET_4267 [Cymbomonas tetramitiformis]|uniref:Uncharacterized protein n=1 Tax=Cymbomonas tetramitiformis TaxID=36881 RepID=A0AAE0H1N8_9CHLO|nr:hypothetical protein CYMTET_4267 [Cymbomonas tetramitiformis]